MKLYNTLTRQEEEIIPNNDNIIRMYTCGPTVYWNIHTGNLRAYTASDVLYRVLVYLGYDVKRIMNFTDVGHMTSDENFGDDKIEKSARENNLSPQQIANMYIVRILQDFRKTNILAPNGKIIPEGLTAEEAASYKWIKATDSIEEMIKLVQMIEKNGFSYETDQAVYFDVAKYPDYTKLSRQKLDDKIVGVRDEVNVDPQKKHAADFVLWMKAVGNYADHIMKWNSPWGIGFPGWHIECSAMAHKEFGEEFEIHTGGTDHIPVHHTNEIAQNFGAFGHDSVKYWFHSEMLVAKDGLKLSKSKKNVYFLDEIVDMGYDPMDLRYYYLNTNYRMPLVFSFEGLDSARNGRRRLVAALAEAMEKTNGEKGEVLFGYKQKFTDAVSDNLNTPVALAILVDLIKSEEKASDVLATVDDFDRVLGLDMLRSATEYDKTDNLVRVEDISDPNMLKLLEERTIARQNKDFARADSIRETIKEMGYEIVDKEGISYLRKLD